MSCAINEQRIVSHTSQRSKTNIYSMQCHCLLGVLCALRDTDVNTNKGNERS